ncbi:MAG: DUF5683 domain-containing protein [Candidatus Krumholzibacteriia bacterium]|nr:hypothetical protein [bacterium]MCB9512884.1 hypothetical protein [Candidatus Latescibacterota bacterium]MCB9516970.1 hypothetical protein [Candidatus Latescibacterota bacterium]
MKSSRALAVLLLCLLLPAAVSAQDYSPAPVSREGAMLRSLVIPGLGQIEQGRVGRGALWAGGAAALAGATFFAHMEYHSAAKDFENARDSYQRALADGDTDGAYQDYLDMQRLEPIADDRQGTRRNLEIALGLWWAGSLVDTWLFNHDDGGDAGELARGALPGRLSPVLRGEAAGLAWTLDF